METIFMKTKNNKKTKPHIFVLNLSQRLDLRSSNEYFAPLTYLFYYTWKNATKQYKNNKLKLIAPTWNDEFELPDGSYSGHIFKFISNISFKNMKH